MALQNHFNKKGLFGGSRSWISLILGMLILATGILPLLNLLGIVGFNLSFLPPIFMYFIIMIGGIWLIIDGLQEFNNTMRFASIISGGLLAILTGISLLSFLGISSFIPFSFMPITSFIPLIIYSVLETIAGILLLLGAFML